MGLVPAAGYRYENCTDTTFQDDINMLSLFKTQDDEHARFGVNKLQNPDTNDDNSTINEFSLDVAKGAATEIVKEGVKLATATVTTVKNVFRPQFLSRYRSKKIHEKQLSNADK